MTYQTTPHILIVDDDESVCRTLSAILQSEGYQTTTVTTAREAIEKTKTKFFNAALLDIRLPDIEGTELLAQLQEIAPETIKIMITGYPSIQNAVEALKLGADSYIIKPLDPAELLETIKNKLETKQQSEKITKEKLAKWVQSQARKMNSTSFQEFLEEISNELTDFGLTKTQAKIYVTITALGIASASEIAALSKIRREEVYRMIADLGKRGLITIKLGVPRKILALRPELALQLLIKMKTKTMKEETEKLMQKQVRLVSRLEAVKLPTQQDNCSTEIIPKQYNLDSLFTKTIDMIQNARQQIDAIVPFEILKYAYLNCPKNLKGKLARTINIRVICESHEPDVFTAEIIQYAEASNNRIELRRLEKLPFNLLTVDDKEAIWGELQAKKEDAKILWTNETTQIKILKKAFESLWYESTALRRDKT